MSKLSYNLNPSYDPANPAQWLVWYDKVGNAISVGDVVAVATTSGRQTSNLTIGEVVRINRLKSNGEEIGRKGKVWKGPPLPSNATDRDREDYAQFRRDRQDLWSYEFIPNASITLRAIDYYDKSKTKRQTYQNMHNIAKITPPPGWSLT